LQRYRFVYHGEVLMNHGGRWMGIPLLLTGKDPADRF
jgi:hypothetical protein